jgi:hypothetical protein
MRSPRNSVGTTGASTNHRRNLTFTTTEETPRDMIKNAVKLGQANFLSPLTSKPQSLAGSPKKPVNKTFGENEAWIKKNNGRFNSITKANTPSV